MDARTAHYRDRVRQLEDEIAELKSIITASREEAKDKPVPVEPRRAR